MLGLIKQSGEPASGKWDVADAPGGGGSWGGSWLAVPTQSKHPKEAAELVQFLTSPQGQIAAFKAANNLPSSPQALNDPALKAFTNPYFNNAPVGQIFGAGATQPQAGLPRPEEPGGPGRGRGTCWRSQQGSSRRPTPGARPSRTPRQAATVVRRPGGAAPAHSWPPPAPPSTPDWPRDATGGTPVSTDVTTPVLAAHRRRRRTAAPARQRFAPAAQPGWT